jgi:hypothetical protein
MKLGYASPRAMLGEMSLRDLGRWAALWAIDPWGEERADRRAGTVSYVVAEVNRNSKTKPTPYKPEDFMPYSMKDREAHGRELSARLRASFPKRKKK